MNIVIAGAGEVGSHLARLLSNEDQDIMIIDDNQERLFALDSKYNLMTHLGNPVNFRTLRDASVAACDLFIAVMPNEADNMLACSMAKLLGAKRTVARITHYGFMMDENKQFVQKLGVDTLIYPEYLAALQIRTSLQRTWVRQWFEILNGEIIVVGVRIRENAKLCGMQLKDFAFTHHNFHVSAIKRGHEIVIPRGNDSMQPGDILYITTLRNNVGDLLSLTGKVEHRVHRVLIMGGSKIAMRIVQLCRGEYKFTIVDKNREVCELLPEKCPGIDDIYCGDARDIDTLNDLGVSNYDAFIALTNSSEANILACLTAREAGVKKTIAEVEDLQFINQAENLNIGTVINKKLLASSSIFQLLLDNDSSTPKCLAMTDAEVAELVVKPNAKITRDLVKNLKLSHDMTLAGLVRDGHGQLVTGSTQIQAGDHVVVFCLAGSLHHIEKLFS